MFYCLLQIPQDSLYQPHFFYVLLHWAHSAAHTCVWVWYHHPAEHDQLPGTTPLKRINFSHPRSHKMATVPKLGVEVLPNVFFILLFIYFIILLLILISIKIMSLIIHFHKCYLLCHICLLILLSSSSCLFPWVPFLSPINYPLLSCPVCGMEGLCLLCVYRAKSVFCIGEKIYCKYIILFLPFPHYPILLTLPCSHILPLPSFPMFICILSLDSTCERK